MLMGGEVEVGGGGILIRVLAVSRRRLGFLRVPSGAPMVKKVSTKKAAVAAVAPTTPGTPSPKAAPPSGSLS